MDLLLYIYLFLFGLVFGSFYNVVGIRLAHGASIVAPRSHCPKCGHVLTAGELIPVLSYLIQKGRCRGCGSQVSAKYPFFELATASLFTISPLVTGWSKDLLIALLLVSLVVIITISDLDSMIIPNQVLLFFTVAGVLARLFVPTVPWWSAYAGALAGFLLLFLLGLLSNGGMGGGDIKLFAVLGLYVGLKGIILVLVLAAFLGLVFGMLLMALGRIKRKDPLPFGPFIGVAALLVFYLHGWFDHLLNLLYQIKF